MKSAPRARRSTEAPRLNRDDWLDAAFHAVLETGFDQVRVLGLAEALGVTRGSFYWHFTDHADLLGALVQRWRDRERDAMARLRQGFTGQAQTDLELLLDTALARAGDDFEHVRFELALRALGRRDPEVANILLQIDAERLELFEDRFVLLTGDARQATDLAALFYLAIVGGNQALSRPATNTRLASYLKGVITDYLIRRQAGPSA